MKKNGTQISAYIGQVAYGIGVDLKGSFYILLTLIHLVIGRGVNYHIRLIAHHGLSGPGMVADFDVPMAERDQVLILKNLD
jgi:hypothetical protein